MESLVSLNSHTLHRLRFGSFNGLADFALVSKSSFCGLVCRLLLLQTLLQHLQLIGHVNLVIALLLLGA